MDGTPNPSGLSLVRDLRHALLHLYNAIELRRSPLIHLLGAGKRDDPPVALRHLLLQAIDALKPPADVPAQASAWRTYNVLALRYVEQYSQGEVATDLALSIRQVRREESQALRALADLLCVRHNLQCPFDAGTPAVASAGEPPVQEGATPSREQEMEWLRRSLSSEVADAGELVRTALATISPLARATGVQIEHAVPDTLPRLIAQQAALRQALLNVLTAAIRSAPGGQVSLQVEAGEGDIRFAVRSWRGTGDPALLGKDAETLQMAHDLVSLAGGTLSLATESGRRRPFSVEIVIPAKQQAEQVAVLVIDDNADTLELMRRYLSGTRYRFAGARDPEQALALAEETPPSIIILDVMLPGTDGWQVIERLREHPRVHGVPVIVCTILPQEDLALALGAAAFLRKPVSRGALLAALHRQMASPAKEAP